MQTQTYLRFGIVTKKIKIRNRGKGEKAPALLQSMAQRAVLLALSKKSCPDRWVRFMLTLESRWLPASCFAVSSWRCEPLDIC